MNQKISKQNKGTIKDFTAVGFSRDMAIVLAFLYERKRMTSREIRRTAGIRDYQCNKIMQFLVKRKWIGYFAVSSGKRGHPENTYYPTMKKEDLIIAAQIFHDKMACSKGSEPFYSVFLYIFRSKRVKKESIIKHLKGERLYISKYQLDKILAELKRRKWVKSSQPFTSRTIYYECIVALSEVYAC